MDIARIRKKLKKLEAPDEQKTKEALQEERIKEVPEIADTKSVRLDSEIETEQEDAKKTREESKTESPDVEVEAKAVPIEGTEILAFRIANEEYAVKIAELQEVMRNQRITAVPRSPKYLKGVTSIRGKILPIVDLRERLGLTDKNTGKEKIIIISGKKEPLGILVGAVLGVFRFPSSEFLPPPSTMTDEEKGFIEGVVKINSKFISILKVDEVLKMEAL
jgi:purine-binding chemotaxis protein CheW